MWANSFIPNCHSVKAILIGTGVGGVIGFNIIPYK